MSVLSHNGPAGAKQIRDLHPEVVMVEDVQSPPVVRVKLGKLNGTYGIEVYTPNGVLAFSSAYNTFKIHATGIISIAFPGRSSSVEQDYTVLTHNLGYPPIFLGFVEFGAGVGSLDGPITHQKTTFAVAQLASWVLTYNCVYCTIPNATQNTPNLQASWRRMGLWSNATTLYVRESTNASVESPLGAVTWGVRYYILVETGATA